MADLPDYPNGELGLKYWMAKRREHDGRQPMEEYPVPASDEI
jgi:hypothetical protein